MNSDIEIGNSPKVTFFARVLLSGLVITAKTRYQWKDQSLLTLLLTNLLA